MDTRSSIQTSESKHANRHTVNRNSKIRNRYLTALGFFDLKVAQDCTIPTNARNDRFIVSKEPVKIPREVEKSHSCEKFFKKPPTHMFQQLNARSTSAVSFQQHAVVYPVPSRHSFSKRMKGQLWLDPREFMCNAQRNMIEFAFEKNDWRQVLEEDRFYVCTTTGTRIHPVHYVRRLSQLHAQISPFPRVLQTS